METRIGSPNFSRQAREIYHRASEAVFRSKPNAEDPLHEIHLFLSKLNKEIPSDLQIFPDACFDVDRNDPRLAEFISGYEKEYEELYQKALAGAQSWRVAYKESRDVSTQAYRELLELRRNFSTEADRLRLHRNRSRNPHPKNVHIITSSSQYFTTTSSVSNKDATEKLPWNIRLMTGLLQGCSSMAKVIQRACLSSYIPEPVEQKIYFPPVIEKSVSSRGAGQCPG